MKIIKTVEAKRNAKPFLTQFKEYLILGENDNKYKVKNDLGNIAWEDKSDFFKETTEHEYGITWEKTFEFFVMIPTPVIYVDKEEFVFIISLPFCLFGFTYKFKPKF